MGPLDGVTIFVTVAECRSFSAAAEKLGCSKSTASEQITRLEERIGARLFNRSSRAVTLTEAGRAYLCQIDDVLDRVAAPRVPPRRRSTSRAVRSGSAFRSPSPIPISRPSCRSSWLAIPR